MQTEWEFVQSASCRRFSEEVAGFLSVRADATGRRVTISFEHEPTVEDLLSDPLVQTVMAGDNVGERELRTLIASTRSALAERRNAECGF